MRFRFLVIFSLFFLFGSFFVAKNILAKEETEIGKTRELRISKFSIQKSDLSQDFFISSFGEQNISDLNSSQKWYYSGELSLEFFSNAVGFAWDSSLQEEDLLQVKFFEHNHWSEWILIKRGDIQARIPSKKIFSDLHFPEKASRLVVRSNNSLLLETLEIIYIDSTPGPKLISVASTTGLLQIISRAQWGADESYRFREKSELEPETLQELLSKGARVDGSTIEIWPVTYADPKKFVMHETDGYNGGDDPASTVRGIYHWHAKTLGWGDIGYNYLVDPKGNIYEGRTGGDGAIGGHVYHRETVTNENGEKVVLGFNMNVGSIGISMLGSYDTDLSNGTAQAMVARLVAQKAVDFGFDPLGSDPWKVPIVRLSKESSDAAFLEALPKSTKLFDIKGIRSQFDTSDLSQLKIILENVFNFTGHKDIDYKRDPQENLMIVFTNARTLASQEYQKRLRDGVRFAATLLTQTGSEIKLKKDESMIFEVQVRNDGDTTWHSYTQKRVLLASSDITQNLVSLHQLSIATSLLETKAKELYFFSKPNIAPNEVATIQFLITPPQNKAKELREYVLAFDTLGYLESPRVQITVVNLDLALAPFASEFLGHDVAPAYFDTAKPAIHLKYKNVGKEAWKKEELALNMIEVSAGEKPSPWKGNDWLSEFGKFTFSEAQVAPEGEAIFTIPVSHFIPGLYRHRFYITRKVIQNGFLLGEEKIIGSDAEFATRVDPVFGALVSHNFPLAIKTTWRIPIEMKIKNIGFASWKGNLELKNLYRPEDVKLSFIDNSWVSKDVIVKKNVTLKPQEEIVLKFKIDAPKKPGAYEFQYKLILGKQEIFIGKTLKQTISVRVD